MDGKAELIHHTKYPATVVNYQGVGHKIEHILEHYIFFLTPIFSWLEIETSIAIDFPKMHNREEFWPRNLLLQ